MSSSTMTKQPCVVVVSLFLIVWFALPEAVVSGNGPKDYPLTLEFAYGQALDHYVAENWKESVTYLKLSLRLYRLMKESVAFCCNSCRHGDLDGDPAVGQSADPGLRTFWHILLRASCVKRCKIRFPPSVFRPLGKEITEDFERRTPYQYLHFAYHELDETENAASAAHTYLQKNPNDTLMVERMKIYTSIPGLEDSLTNHEERQYERSFLTAVLLLNSGDYSGSVIDMEEALREYLQEHALCTAACEGAVDVVMHQELYASLADACIEALRCKVKCEENLIPSVGGFFVEKFVATMYHHLQFAYYKMNDARRAVPCASSYMLFDPSDEVMKQNMHYYYEYRQQWGLQQRHFYPRPEAERYFNQTATQRRMLEYTEKYLQQHDEEVVWTNEERSGEKSISLDQEFEGNGDYEEGIYAKWSQEPKSKWDSGEPED
ncbi:endoplasmic reticulum protein SC65-like [Pygocentrus nattereri]|uniref:Leprecan-like alpha-helical domain-containing protein n=1 Tax=Pygocentrus nattereri TaxID=42514 RepID=A0A3B4C3E1_PYGNA|nr:endoplasmic reticulum protein SC65-like [Pygocentrus nattereri]